MKTISSTEERVWAVLAHLSALALGMGLLLPIIGWSEQRRKSNYISFQCLQALGYQSLGYTVWLLSYFLLMVILLIAMVVVVAFSGENGEAVGAFTAVWSIIFTLSIFGAFGLYFLLPIFAAVACALGRDFRYPFMGNRLERYLGYEPNKNGSEPTWLIEDHEDRWVAAMGHFSVIIMLWGLLAPATAWILQSGRSLFLKFQTAQTFVYQVLVTVLYFGSTFLMMAGAFLLMGVVGFFNRPNPNPTTEMAGLGVFFVFMIIGMLILLLIPLFHILGQWAGYRVLKGDDYKYPLVGKWVEGRVRSQVHSVREENIA